MAILKTNLFRASACAVAILGAASAGDCARGADDPAAAMVTRWAREVSADSVWPEYPRPQMVRDEWLNLNGEWSLAITGEQESPPTAFPETVLVPFPLESHLGGVARHLSQSHRAWYRRTFRTDANWEGRRLLLHFGAVDWRAEVWVNGRRVGEHRGGYDPFTFEITAYVTPDEENVIVVGVDDPTDSGSQPRGKQKASPEGIWYTPVSGIWQTVWLEPVPATSVERLLVTPNYDDSTVVVVADAGVAGRGSAVEVDVKTGATTVASGSGAAGQPITVALPAARAWSPDDPFLYDLEVRLVADGKASDRVTSYFGMRSITLGTDRNGQTRMMLNGQPVFQYGPLDQGYWPDGLYTAPCDEAQRADLELIKRLGFNMVRKHVKVEPARWYWWCDRLGLLVWQDMPNGGEHAPWPADGLEIERSPSSAAQYRLELERLIDSRRHFPSIVVWVPFNEAWGQFDTEAVTRWVQDYDPSRLVVAASGGNDFGGGDLKDDHFYPGPGAPPAERARGAALGEFGGFGLPVRGHTYQSDHSWGYRNFHTVDELNAAYQDATAKLRPLVESHLSAAVYTQLTDVEGEVNGLVTYDREFVKMDEAATRTAHAALFQPLPALADEQRVAASVLAWWRFDDGRPGELASDLTRRMGAVAARDFSGHNNHLYAFSPQNAPAFSDATPHRALAGAGRANVACLDDSAAPGGEAASRDLFTNPHLSGTHMDLVDRFAFSEWTIEASFRAAQAGAEQVVLAKEVDQDGKLAPLFQLGFLGNPPTIGVSFLDAEGSRVALRSDVVPTGEDWRHVVCTCDGSVARLYIAADAAGASYRLVAEAPSAGALDRRDGTWLVGRGSEGGRMGRDFRGWIDEVRISTKALVASQFLFSAPPAGAATSQAGE